jgi:Flp pilus assembly protein TadD
MSRTLQAVVLILSIGASGPALAMGGDAATALGSEEYKAGKEAVEDEQFEKAVMLLTKAVRTDPSNADAQNLLGFSYRKLGKYDEALIHYQKALALDPYHKGAYEYMGEAYLELGDLPKAEDLLAGLVRLCPDSCAERTSLQQAIDTYKKAKPAG